MHSPDDAIVQLLQSVKQLFEFGGESIPDRPTDEAIDIDLYTTKIQYHSRSVLANEA